MPIDVDTLRTQVLPADRTDPDHDITTDLGAGMVVRLVAATSAGPRALARSAVDLDPGSLMRIAVGATVRAELEGVDVRPHTVGDHRFLAAATDGSPYVSSLLISPGPPFGLAGVPDLLVAAPRHSIVLCRPLDRHFAEPAAELDRLVATVHGDAPDPCSPRVFWWRDGSLHGIRVDHETGDVTYPPELADRVSALPDQI